MCWQKFLKYQTQNLEAISMGKLLEKMRIVNIPSTAEPFDPCAFFVVNKSSDATVKIGYIDEKFTKWFLSGKGKQEGARGESSLLCLKLTKYSDDTSILVELDDTAETTLFDVAQLLKIQGCGGEGVLILKEWYGNKFYVTDQEGILRMISLDRIGTHWNLFAYDVSSRNVWNEGYHVFSRN